MMEFVTKLLELEQLPAVLFGALVTFLLGGMGWAIWSLLFGRLRRAVAWATRHSARKIRDEIYLQFLYLIELSDGTALLTWRPFGLGVGLEELIQNESDQETIMALCQSLPVENCVAPIDKLGRVGGHLIGSLDCFVSGDTPPCDLEEIEAVLTCEQMLVGGQDGFSIKRPGFFDFFFRNALISQVPRLWMFERGLPEKVAEFLPGRLRFDKGTYRPLRGLTMLHVVGTRNGPDSRNGVATINAERPSVFRLSIHEDWLKVPEYMLTGEQTEPNVLRQPEWQKPCELLLSSQQIAMLRRAAEAEDNAGASQQAAAGT